MNTFKKKDISKYSVKKKSKEIDGDELDELVNSTGGVISGDDIETPSEIKTAPQNTTDNFAQTAIQPNRYLYNVNGMNTRVNDGVVDKIAKDKFYSLLEDFSSDIVSNDSIMDVNDNGILDIDELPSNVASKLNVLIDSVFKNNLNDKQIDLIINYINNKLKNNA